jgi:hypothetical protein
LASGPNRPRDFARSLDTLERFLLRVFLRRYVTRCARRRRFAQMQGAARLFRNFPTHLGGKKEVT